MKSIFAVMLLSVSTLMLGASTALAGNRTQAGLWETKMSVGSGEPMIATGCITGTEAVAMNGDLDTIRQYLEQTTATNTQGRCSIKNVALNDNRLDVTTVCGTTEVISKTTYHGDHYESTSSGGASIQGKRLGDCP